MKNSYLRMLVWIIPVSYIYDIFWMYQKTTEYWIDKTEGGLAQVILMMVYFVFFFKIFLWVIMWKASLNYTKFVKQ